VTNISRWLLLIFILTGALAVSAQAEITLEAYTDEIFGLESVVPETWTEVSPGLYVRSAFENDPTWIAQQAAPVPANTALNALLPQMGLTEAPEPAGEREANGLTWTLYETEVSIPVHASMDLALASFGGRTFLVALNAVPDERDALYEAVFLPAVDALRPWAGPEATDLPYAQEEVQIENGDVTLAGTLTLPPGDGPHPAVVLVSGSGPQDRDESLAPVSSIRPFRLIADALTRNGIAVLRYDDRGTAESTGDYNTATLHDFASDAQAAIDYLMSRDDIDPEQVGILGHSEGGLVAAMLAAGDTDLAFLIALAGPAVGGHELLEVQNRRLMETAGASEEQIEGQLEFLRQAFELVNVQDWGALETLLEDTVRDQIEDLPESQRAVLGDVDAYVEQVLETQMETFRSDWFASFLAYDPVEDWQSVTIPVLAIFGGLDVQVDAEQNVPPLEAALAVAENPDVTIVTIPNANHLFQEAITGGVQEYGMLEPDFTDELLPTIIDWLAERVQVATE